MVTAINVNCRGPFYIFCYQRQLFLVRFVSWVVSSTFALNVCMLFLAVTAAQEAHVSLHVFLCSSVRTQVVCLQLLATFGNYWQLLAAIGNFWQLFATFGNFLQLFATIGNFWQLLATIGNFLQLLATLCNF